VGAFLPRVVATAEYACDFLFHFFLWARGTDKSLRRWQGEGETVQCGEATFDALAFTI
jgi:hypothetical protein